MRKINLKLDALAVESFQTDEAPVGTGTVEGQQVSGRPACNPGSYPTEDGSCPLERTEPASCQYGCGCTDAVIIC